MSSLLTLGVNSQPRYITDGLVLYVDAKNLNSYPGTGGTTFDISGNSNDGTLLGGTGHSTTYGGIFTFDGVDDRITFSVLDPIADGLFADASSQWTVSSWFIPDITNTAQGAITGKGGGTGGSATYVVWETGTSLFVRLRGGTILTISTSLTNALTEVVITWDGTTAKAYLNGEFVNNISVGVAAKQTNVFSMGATGGGNNTRFKGSIADTKVYNRALSAAEISYNYSSFRGSIYGPISWRGLVYYPIESDTGKIWLDRNLGATRTATSATDSSAYGYLFQWGRFWDGHEITNSTTTTTNATTAVPSAGNVWDGKFIIETNSPWDWLTVQDNTLWQGVTGTNNPCPPGYRLPTETELNDERLTWSTNNSAGAYASPLKFPSPGYRGVLISGNRGFIGTHGFYLSSNVSSVYSRLLYFRSDASFMSSNRRADGFSVRCICDNC